MPQRILTAPEFADTGTARRRLFADRAAAMRTLFSFIGNAAFAFRAIKQSHFNTLFFIDTNKGLPLTR